VAREETANSIPEVRACLAEDLSGCCRESIIQKRNQTEVKEWRQQSAS
jgi:hypothetical protein